ncbi:MAG TPA: SDR family oxidoreductase [Xanthobacteraceae bacterium]|jgi:NAD(P)-dependent dehydrogenase (short-subunit alcohol dehydrogenase family)
MPASGGRVVVLTGAAGGLGRAMTAALLGDGHAIAAVDRDAAAMDRLIAEHSGAADRLAPILVDLASEQGCRDAVEQAAARFGRVDAVINNAGIGVSSLRPDAETRHPDIEELTPEIWDRFYAVNVRAPVLLTRAAVPGMRARGWGRIVNNTTSYRTMLRVLPYGATKAALEATSAVWAEEFAGSGITVNVLVPGGPTDTPFVGAGVSWPRDQMLKPVIMGPPARWLMSDASDGFTGQRITAGRWDAALPPAEAARAASRAIGWPELAADAVWLQAKPA